MLANLHFHLGKQNNLEETLRLLANEVDIAAITGRGSVYSNDFEYGFETLRDELVRQGIDFLDTGEKELSLDMDGRPLYLISAIELHTAEGYDIVIVGGNPAKEDYMYFDGFRETAGDGLVILSTPYQVPNTLRWRDKNCCETEIIAEKTDAIEVFNPFLPGFLNRYAEELVERINKPGIAVSDTHRYSQGNRTFRLSSIEIQEEAIDFEKGIVDSIKQAVFDRNYENIRKRNWADYLEFFYLSPKQMIRLFRGSG